MGDAATTGGILYWKPDQLFYINIHNHVWFYEYNYHVSYEDKNIPRPLQIQLDPYFFLQKNHC